MLQAGSLTAEFDQGALRFIKVDGTEAIRSIGYLVRDKDWGTYAAAITNLDINQQENSFDISFDALCKDDTQEMQYSVRIHGAGDSSLKFECTARTNTDFLTNRIGFVVLHPIVGVAGSPVTIEHTDGTNEASTFPLLIDPVQPFMDIRTMTHEVTKGVKVACKMDGDVFETEDHRQWNDASYKTYSRPIGLPWPYTINAGDIFDQSVTLTVSGKPEQTNNENTDVCHIDVSTVADASPGILPAIGLGLEPQHAVSALKHAPLVKSIGAQLLVCWHDLRAGHGAAELERAKTLAEKTGVLPVLEAVIPCTDYRAELELIASQVAEAQIQFTAVTFSPADYLMSIMPGDPNWPDVPPLEDIYDYARELFPGVTLGGGMFSFFTELNRFPPPVEHLDYITHTSNTITHACDDHTVTENLETLPQIINTCRSFAGGKPYRIGPSSIGMRFNPYGSKTMDNPGNNRIAMARIEPRQRGLLNAAWTIGYLAHTIRDHIDVVTLHAPTGEFGVIYSKHKWNQPGFDECSREVYPAFHALRGIASASGCEKLAVTSSNSHDIEALGYIKNGRQEIWIANLTCLPQSTRISGVASQGLEIRRLNSDTFDVCTEHAEGFASTSEKLAGAELSLQPYEVVHLKAI